VASGGGWVGKGHERQAVGEGLVGSLGRINRDYVDLRSRATIDVLEKNKI